MDELVPIKVKITLGRNNKHRFPRFNLIDADLRGDMDWAYFFESHGLGWHTDSLSDIGNRDRGDPEDPHRNDELGSWNGATCIPADFAEAAVARFPGTVEIISEESFELFYNNRAHAHEEEIIVDLDVLQGLKVRLDLEAMENAPTKPPSSATIQKRKEILDPESQRRGIRKNLTKSWADFKKARGVKIRAQEAKPE